jgi:hypothetical protein
MIPEVVEDDDLQLVTSEKRHLCMMLTRRSSCNGTVEDTAGRVVDQLPDM